MSGRVITASNLYDLRLSSGVLAGQSVLFYFFDGPTFVDLAGAGANAIHLPIGGDASAERPLELSISIGDGLGASISTTLQISGAGNLDIPLQSFDNPDPALELAHIATVIISLTDCPSCAETSAERHHTLGPISFTSVLPTPTAKRSWGQLKSIYR